MGEFSRSIGQLKDLWGRMTWWGRAKLIVQTPIILMALVAFGLLDIVEWLASKTPPTFKEDVDMD